MKLNAKHYLDFESYLNNIGLKKVTRQKHLLYYRHFRDMFNSFITQGTIDSFLQQKLSPTHRAMIKHLIEVLKRDDNLTEPEKIEAGRFMILKKMGRGQKSIMRIMEKNEVIKLINNTRLGTDFSTQRLKLMMAWQYYAGMRVGELCGLRFSHLNYKGRRDFIDTGRDKLKYQVINIPKELGKGNKEGNVYVRTVDYVSYFDFLKRWLEIDFKKANKIRTNQYSIWNVNHVRYSKQFKEQFSNILGWRLPDGKASHILRHSRATHLLQEGREILWVRDFMRHSSVSSTEVYVHLSKDRIRKGLEGD